MRTKAVRSTARPPMPELSRWAVERGMEPLWAEGDYTCTGGLAGRERGRGGTGGRGAGLLPPPAPRSDRVTVRQHQPWDIIRADDQGLGVTLTAVRRGEEVGRLGYLRSGDVVTVWALCTEPGWQRSGVATALTDRLYADNPGAHVGGGFITPEGQGFARAYDARRGTSLSASGFRIPPAMMGAYEAGRLRDNRR
jgi:GNAT superfamily N-acetyltransferase